VFGIGALKVFDQAFIVSGGTGGPVYSTYTAVLYIYNEAFKSANFGVAASAGVVLFVAIFILTVIQRATIGRTEIG
jgi:multiple sugar transport system permease protein